MAEKIVAVNALEQYRKDYTDYALYVQRHRTTLEYRDGLKPVQRRIIYAALHNTKADDGKRKCANVIGDTMGRYHPHGDASIEGALYNLSTWWQSKIPLFTGQGNFGNTYENVPASPRYTEVELSEFAKECVTKELKEFSQVTDWEPTYDNMNLEPQFLPCRVPLLLVNGCMAIAVGEKMDIPSHNLCDVIDATIALIKNPEATVSLVPDHCQCCEIEDTDWLSISKNGYGHYRIRGVIDIEPYNGINKRFNGTQTLVIKSCPDYTFLGKVIDKLDELVKANKIIGIWNTEENSTKDNMRYTIILRPGTDPEYVRSEIYKRTAMAQTCRVNLKVLDCLDKETPIKRVSYTGYLKAWIGFRKMTKLRYYENKLQKLITRLHVLENYIGALESGKADIAIDMIKRYRSRDETELIELLVSKLKVTDLQAKFFVNCEIKKLSMGYLKQYKEEAAKLNVEAAVCRDALRIPGKLEEIIVAELAEIKNKFGEPRKCKVISKNEFEGIATGTFQAVFTDTNFVKKIGINDKPNAKDKVKFVVSAENGENLFLFDNIGRVYSVPMAKLPFGDKNSNGTDIRIINKYINAQLVAVIPERYIKSFKNCYMFTLTKNGYIKKVNVYDLITAPFSGLVYSKVDSGDVVSHISMGQDNNDVIVYSKNKALRIPLNSVPLLKRNSRGNVAMSNTDSVEGMFHIANEATEIVVVTEKGYFNKIIIDTLPVNKNKRGSNVIKLNKGDSIVSICGVCADTKISCVTVDNQSFIINVSDIPNGSTVSPGVKMVKGSTVKEVCVAYTEN